MKKTLIVALGLVTALSLCAITGCSSSSNTSNTSTTSTETSDSIHDKTNTNTVTISTLGSSTKAGDYVEFGNYVTDTDGTKSSPISWLVLTVQDGKAELISTAGLDCVQFNSDLSKGNNYATSDIKTFLEGDFKTNAFSADEQKKLAGEPTLLTAEEAAQYFSGTTNIEKSNDYQVSTVSNDAIRCLPTDYAVEQGALKSGAITGDCDWWLQSAGTGTDSYNDTNYAQFVNNVGEIRTKGCLVTTDKNAVRPVIWVTL